MRRSKVNDAYMAGQLEALAAFFDAVSMALTQPHMSEAEIIDEVFEGEIYAPVLPYKALRELEEVLRCIRQRIK